jgi:mersacidin/lichenicidin family type 2 lantibiotic
MSIKDIIRAWKDSSFRASLNEEQRALLPANPIGEMLSEEQLQAITGGLKDQCSTDTSGCSCTGNEGCMITIASECE